MSLCIYAQTRKERPLLGVRRLKRCLPAKTREAKAEQQPGCEEILGAEFWFACDLCDSWTGTPKPVILNIVYHKNTESAMHASFQLSITCQERKKNKKFPLLRIDESQLISMKLNVHKFTWACSCTLFGSVLFRNQYEWWLSESPATQYLTGLGYDYYIWFSYNWLKGDRTAQPKSDSAK